MRTKGAQCILRCMSQCHVDDLERYSKELFWEGLEEVGLSLYGLSNARVQLAVIENRGGSCRHLSPPAACLWGTPRTATRPWPLVAAPYASSCTGVWYERKPGRAGRRALSPSLPSPRRGEGANRLV